MRAHSALRTAALTAAGTAVVTVTTGLLALAATPAVATVVPPDDGADPGNGLTVLQTLGIFVGIPVLLFVVITILVVAPSAARGPRYRPGVGWWAAPVWFNGPDDAERAVRESAGASNQGGGASARW